MKRIINVTIIFYLVIFIYHNFSHQKKLVLSFGNDINANYVYKYNNTKVTDIINDINSNVKIKDRFIQNILVKSSTIYFDLNELFNCQNYNCIYANLNDLDKLLNLVRKYCKEEIIIKLLTGNNEYADYINQKVMILAEKYDIITMR